ncbi:MAG TPA: cytochrome c-type biogenesis protein CcmH [Gemmatimonadota bacterium]|nr:cytochrome c-type biogenesis protein CcmH [Gemmatimonadota bacterium]
MSRTTIRALAAVVTAWTAVGAVPSALRSQPVLAPDQEARALALESELRCPVCRSQSIRQSRSFMAEDMKAKLRELIAAGRTDREIRDWFVERYGEWILLTPPRRGFNLAAFLPLVVVVVGAAGVVLLARRWSRHGSSRPAAEPLPPSPHLARLEREIAESE